MKKIILAIIISIIMLSTSTIAVESNGIWHLTQDIRPGTFGSDETSGDYIFEDSVFITTTGRGLTSSSTTDDGIMGESSANSKSAIYALASNGAYSGYFEGGNFVVSGGNLKIQRAETTGQPSFLSVTNSIAHSLELKYTEQAIGSIPADVWQFRAGGSTHSIAFSNYNNMPTLFLNTAGNVGIGTTSPSTKLEVVGGAIKATGGLIIEVRGSNPTNPEDGRMWLIN